MNTILKNASSFLTILETAHLPRVSSWEGKDLRLALEWAAYYQKLYDKFHQDQRARPFLNCEFRKLSYRCCILLDTFSFDFLQNCRNFLLNALSNNKHLSTFLQNEVNKLCPKSDLRRTPLFKCSMLHSGAEDIVSLVCHVIDDAAEFYKTANNTTEAPLRAVRSLLSRASTDTKNQSEPNSIILRCFLTGSADVQKYIIDWMSVSAGRQIWLRSKTSLLASCSAFNPTFLKLHLQFVLALFELTYCVSSRHKDKPLECTNNTQASDALIFDTNETQEKHELVDLLKHIMILDATSNKVQAIIRNMLDTLSNHAKYGDLSSSILDMLTRQNTPILKF